MKLEDAKKITGERAQKRRAWLDETMDESMRELFDAFEQANEIESITGRASHLIEALEICRDNIEDRLDALCGMLTIYNHINEIEE